MSENGTASPWKVLCTAAAGFGHMIPVISLATKLRDAGHDVSLLTRDDETAAFAAENRIPGLSLPKESPTAAWEPFLAVPVLQSHHPDITINDWDISLWLALRAWQPACRVSILRCEQLLGYRRRNLFLSDKFGLATGRSTRMFNAVLEQGGYAPLGNSRELFAGDLIVIPGVPQLDPLDERAQEFYPASTFVYTGPLFMPTAAPVADSLSDWLAQKRHEAVPIILITLGTVAWGDWLYEELANCFAGGEFAVVMIVPAEPVRRDLEARNSSWLRVTGMTDFLSLARQADLVVHHCGHATTQLILLAGKPSLTLPSGDYDREDNALRLEDLGCGRHLGHDFFRRGIRPAEVAQAARELLQSSAIGRGVAVMSKVIEEYVATRGYAEVARALARHMA